MKNSEFKFQDPGEGIHEAEVLEVLVSEGDDVREGQDVLVVETDKAAFELAAPRSGRIGAVEVNTGDKISVGDILLRFEAEGKRQKSEEDQAQPQQDTDEGSGDGRSEDGRSEDDESEGDEPEARTSEEADAGSDEERAEDRQDSEEAGDDGDPQKQATPDEGLAAGAGSGRAPVPATPATRRLARELDVDLTQVTPTGEEGRVLAADVQKYADERGTDKKPATPPKGDRKTASENFDFSKFGPTERQPLRSVRRKTAERMARAWSNVPHVTHHDELDITELETWRQRVAPKIEAAGGKLTLTVLVMKALAANLREFPRFNTSLDAEQEELIFKHYVNIGVAVDTERGLLVPVVRDVPSKTLKELSKELGELSERTRKGESARRDLTGGTFTLTNVGPLGGTGFTPIINYPEVAILGLARATLRSVYVGDLDDHELSTRFMLPVSLAFDHRVIDGAESARFVRRLGERLSDLEAFLLDS